MQYELRKTTIVKLTIYGLFSNIILVKVSHIYDDFLSLSGCKI